ncbi:MAG: NADPH-dependent 7-cyano-7-deazaguanine reductase QueF [Legionellales bacterium]|nr:NADPH-dependent 7-cyano-7-deazaguanine reductase QueF [Legionellales bacterium]
MKNNQPSPMYLDVTDSPLGKKSEYSPFYNPNLLFAIPRKEKRAEIGISQDNLPFFGFDRWNHYEVSWLNAKGKSVVATVEILYSCHSPNIIESKSMKLYFNSFNNTKIASISELKVRIASISELKVRMEQDLSERVGSKVEIKINPAAGWQDSSLKSGFSGYCIDELDVECDCYIVNPDYLNTTGDYVEEHLYSNLLKSNCLVTNQPDWGSIEIKYKGKAIDKEGLLKYIVSFRDHNEFHEQCIERTYMDIKNKCNPDELSVYGRYTRRGGLDINPYRSSVEDNNDDENMRLFRQ